MDLVGIKISLIPVPGLENFTVDPIPTPEIVPNPTLSTGLKYNSLLSIKSDTPNFLLKLKTKFLGFWETRLFLVWAVPTVELYSLNTLILDKSLSTFKTFTHSSPIPKRSFSLI